MKNKIILAAVFTAALGSLCAQGSGNSLDLSANTAAKNHLDCGDLPLGTSDFTVEFWYQSWAPDGDPAIFSNKDWDSGSNTGLNVAIQSGGTNMDINFKGSTGERVDMNVTGVDFSAGWNHVALVFDREGQMVCYVNGVEQVSADISGSTGDISTPYSFKFGQDGTGDYSWGYQANGKADELRIWSDLRTVEEIRNNMCIGLTGTEDNLIAYYTFDTGLTETVIDETGTYPGTIIGFLADSRSVSGAYIGNEVIFEYPEDWTGLAYTLLGESGSFTVNNIAGEMDGIHVFKVNEIPNSSEGIYTLLSNEIYYGVFLVNASGATYDVNYNYNAFADALANEDEVGLYYRTGNDTEEWMNAMAIITPPSDEMDYTTSVTREYMLGFAEPGVDPEPSDAHLGAGMALDFDGSTNWVDVSNGKVTAAELGLPTDAITVETWVYVRNFETWNSMISFLQDNGSFERGWDLEVRNDNKFAFALAASETLTYLETSSTFKTNRWYHVAGTYDGTTQKIYINGELEAETTANSGPINYDDSWLALGAYKDDNEENHFNGKLDEVRIWSTAKSAEEIRDLMCEMADIDAEDLVAYFQLDETEGTGITDATGHLLPGTMTDMPLDKRVESSAPLGNESVHLYHPDVWAEETLELTGGDNGTLSLEVLKGAPYGVHLYWVDGVPTETSPFDLIEGMDGYYGVFVAEASTNFVSNYKVNWEYASFAEAVALEEDLVLINRPNKVSSIWGITESSAALVEDVLSSDSTGYRNEFSLSTYSEPVCSIPSELGVTALTAETATGIWVNGGSEVSNVQWGPAGFSLGTGTIVEMLTDENVLFDGLMDESYAFYVQDVCEEGNSPWVGPYFFTGERCEDPYDITTTEVTHNSATIFWNGANGTDWTIVWGLAGFDPEYGVETLALEIPHTLSGLAEETTYQFYVRSNCPGKTSDWIGPFEFTTLLNDGAGLVSEKIDLTLIPNPSNGRFFIQASAPIENLSIYNPSGEKIIAETILSDKGAMIQLNEFASGVYFVKVTAAGRIYTAKILIH